MRGWTYATVMRELNAIPAVMAAAPAVVHSRPASASPVRVWRNMARRACWERCRHDRPNGAVEVGGPVDGDEHGHRRAAIRDEPVDDETLERCLRAASWAPSGANQQPWRFVVLRSKEARAVVTTAAHQTWESITGYYEISAPADDADDPKSRVLRAMAEHMRVGGAAPLLLRSGVQPQAGAVRATAGGLDLSFGAELPTRCPRSGLGAAITLWHGSCEDELRSLVGIPDDWLMATLVTVGWPKGGHRTVRRKPLTRGGGRRSLGSTMAIGEDVTTRKPELSLYLTHVHRWSTT